MAESNDVQALSKISSEVDDSQIKIYLSSQCIKAQVFLFEKLRKQTDTQKEIFKHIRNSNSKLEVEIKNAEDDIKSLLLAVTTVKSANVELKKELLLAKENKQETIERIRNGNKKYEALWLQCKTRYESLPHVQKWLTSTQKLRNLNEKVTILTNESNILSKEIDNKKRAIAKTDQDRIIALANYIINEIPNAYNILKQKNDKINKFKKEIEAYSSNKNRQSVIVEVPAKTMEVTDNKEVNNNWPNLYMHINDDTLMMPKLHLKNIDLDGLSAKLDQIKRTDSNCSPLKRSEDFTHERVDIKKPKIDNRDYFSTYFKESFENESNINKDYSKKKLINILEDVKLDDKDTFTIISKVNPDKFHNVEEIKANDGNTPKITDDRKVKNADEKSVLKIDKVIESEVTEEIITSQSGNNLIIPPTQFLDLSQDRTSKSDSLPTQGCTQQVEVMVHKTMNGTPEKLVKETDHKKKVSFDLPSKDPATDIQNDSDKMNDSTNSQLNLSTTSDHSFMNIKNMILKEHNLDLSPQFVYSKNNLQKITDDLTVTSKFFKTSEVNVNNTNDGNVKIIEVKDQFDEAQIEEITDAEMKEDEIVVSSPKSGSVNRQVSGFLFSHGPGAIPESLDVSLSTAGYDEQDIDYQCIDSSVLLSPKADVSMPIPTENEEVTSQEMPNFLSGLRKTGLSFFSKMALESKPDTASQSGFNFNFGNDDKKPRGGLFNMFR